MECRGCGQQNRADSRFCEACGSALAVRCAACDRELNPTARFCDGCGTPVASTDTAARPAPAQAPKPATEAVRKTVTVLFCDLVGSTAFAERVDAESAREAMGRYHSMAKSVIEANGGIVAKFIGDGVMALFGVPEVAEDDADRAVAAGAALQNGFEPVRDHIGARYGVEVGLRVGINTGEVVVDDSDADLVGDVLNTAARLESACTPGQVLVGEETWRLTRSAATYEPLGEVTVKGKRDGLATYQLVLAEGGPRRDGVVGRPDATPFIGRDDELGRLRSLFDEAVATRQARVATIIGSPGVGKTRLARELGTATSVEADVVEVRCERAGTATFAPIVDLLQQVAGLDDGDTPEQIVTALRDLVGDEPDANRVVELLGGFVGTANPRSTEDAFFGVRRLVEVLGSNRPLVLVIDDIQWAEPLFLDLLEHLAEWSKAAAVLIVGLARPELREIRPALAESGRRVALVVSLEGLDAAATERLAAELLGGAALPAELTAKLPTSTDGNPLFVRELIRMLVDDGVIAQREGRWELAVDLDAVAVPPTIQSLLATRVERLPPVERRVLELASVIGPEFPLGALVDLLGDIGRSELEAILERLRRKEQVEPTGAYWGDEPIVRFHHVLIRDAAYRRLLKGARADLHLRVGSWMDRTASGLVGEFEVAIAYHFEQAQLYRRQLGDDDATIAEAGSQAAELLHVAAGRALERDDLSAAAGLSRRAIECLADDADSLSELLVLACESLLSSGDATAGGAFVKRLSERAHGDARLQAWATCFTAQLAVMTDPTGLHQAAEQTQEAATLLETLGDQAGVAKARIVRAGALARLGQVGAAETELDLALTAARAAGDRRRITAVLSGAPVAALWGPSPVARAGGRCLDVVRLSRITADSPAVVATSSRCQAVLEAMRGRFDTARSLLDASRTTSLELGLHHGLLETSLYAGIIELLAGDAAAAEPHLREAFGGLGQLGIGADAGQAAAHLARALLLQGRLDEADDLAADSDALAGQNLQTAIAARSAQAEILAARGETGSAFALADEAVRLATDTDLVFDHANALSTLARVRAAGGDADGAQRAASAARDLFAQKGATVNVEVSAVAPTTPASDSEQTSDTSDESPTVEPSDEPWNEAGRLFRRSMQLFTSGDLVAWEAMLDDGLRGSNRDSGAQVEFTDKADFVRLMEVSLEALGGAAGLEMTTIATRGDDLELSEMHWTRQDDPTGPRIEYLHISQWSAGRQLTSITFGGDELRAAVAELDRLYLETLDPIEGAGVVLNSTYMHAISDRDVDRAISILHPDAVVADHRPLGWGLSLGIADLRDRIHTLADMDGSIIVMARRYEKESPVHILYKNRLQVDTHEGGQLVDDSIIVSQLHPATGLAIRMDQFTDDELAGALAYFDAAQAEIDAVIPAPNTAVRAGGVANARARTASLGEFLAMFADDFTATLADGTIVTLGDLRNGTVEPTALGYGVVDRRVMSVLADRLAMLYVGFDDGTGHWSVDEVDDTHRICGVRQFTNVADAADAIEDRWVELGLTIIPTNAADHLRWIRRVDLESMRRYTAEDFEYVEHRDLGFPSGDRDHYLAMFSATADLLRSDVLVVREVRASCADGWVVSVSQVREAGDGGQWDVASICVVTFRDGFLYRLEQFLDEALDAAMARYHELTGTTPPADAPLADDDEPWNDADRWMRRAIALRSAGRFDEWAACFHEDVVWVSHRSLTGGSYQGRAEVSAAYTDQPVSMSAETLGVRGDSLVLQRHRWIYRDQDVEFEFLLLTRWSADGLLTEATVYDLADLRAAFERLDEWHIEQLAPIAAAQHQVVAAFLEAMNDRDLDRAVRAYLPEFVYEVRRPLSWGRLERHEFVEMLGTFTGYEGRALHALERVEPAGPNVILGFQRIEFIDPHDSVLVSRFVNVEQRLPATGLCIRMDSFESDRADDARAFAEQVAAEAIADPMVNTAVIAGGLANALARYGESSDFLHLLADEFVATLTDGTNVTADHLRDGVVAPMALGYGGVDRRVMSVLTDCLAMLYVGSDDNTGHWSVEEVDDTGRLRNVRQFEHVADAADAIEQRWSELGVDDVNTAILRVNRALRAHDSEALGERLADEFRMQDHRPLGYPPLDREFVVASLAPDSGLAPADPLVVQCVYIVSPRAQVSLLASITDSTSGHVWESQVGITVVGVANGVLTSVEYFPEDGLDAAMARFHELDGRASALDSGQANPDDEPWNDADRWTRRANELRSQGRVGEWMELLDEAIVSEDRQTLERTTYRGRGEVVDRWQGATVPSIHAETIACRGEHLVLQHHVWHFDRPDVEFETLYLSRWNPDGRMVHAVFFDPADLRAAFDQLDQCYIEELPPIDAALERATSAYFEAANDRNLNRALRTLAPDVVSTTHRAVSWGELDRNGVAAGLATITEYDGDALFVNERVDLVGPTSVLLASRLKFTDRHGSELLDRFVTVKQLSPASGLITQMDHFQHDQAHLARELAHRWTAETNDDPMVNSAVIVGGLANALAHYGEPGDFLHLLADDFTATSVDGATVTLDDLRSGAIDPAALGYGVTQRETIAVRGSRLVITRVENTFWSVEELDGDDRLARVRVFADGDLLGAANMLDDVARSLAENAHVPAWVWEFQRAHRNYDLDALAETFDDEVSQIDRRPLGYAPMGKAELIDLIRTGLDDPMLRAVPVYSAIHGAFDGGYLVRGGLWMRGASDDYWTGQPYLNLARAVNGRIVSSDLYPLADLDTALARFDELPGNGQARQDVHPFGRDDPWNDADRRSRELNAIWVDGDGDRWASHLDEHVVWDDHRALVGHRYVGRSDVVEGVGPAGPDILSMRCEPIAVRGDRLVLYRQEMRPSNDPDRMALAHLRIDEWSEDGQLARVASFDPNDLAGAIVELNRRYADEVGFDPLAIGALPMNELITSRDEAAFLAMIDPSCETVDHRPIGWGTVGLDGLRERFRSVALTGDYVNYESRIHRSDATVRVFDEGHVVTGNEGAAVWEIQKVTVVVVDPATGLHARHEQFPVGELDTAMARADELAIEFATVPTPNRAVVTSGSANVWARSQQMVRLLDCFADDFTATLIDGSTVTRDDVVSGAVAPSDLGFGGTRRRVVGVGGERVAMLAATGDDDVVQWSIEVVGDDGRLREIHQFTVDEIAEAIAHYDDRWCAAEPEIAGPIRLAQQLNRCLNPLDLAGLDRVLADDYIMTDHRHLGFGTFDKRQLLEAASAAALTADDGAEGLIIRQVHAATERAVFVGQVTIAVSPSGEMWERFVNIATLGARNGQLTHDDVFEEDQLDAAMARFHELNGDDTDPSDSPSTQHDPWNEADRLHAEMNAKWVQGDRSWSAMLAEHVVWDDRRPGVRHRYDGRQASIDGWDEASAAFARFFAPHERRFAVTTLAVRGDDLVLQHSRFGNDDKIQGEQLEVGQWGPDGLLQETVIFPADDLAAAVDELNRLHLESLDPLDAGQRDIYHHTYSALTRGDLDSAMALIDPGFRFDDHRPLGWGTFDADRMRERFTTITENSGHTVYLARFHGITSTSGCYSAVNHVRSAGGAVVDEELLFVVRFDPATGLMVQADQFESDDVEAALTFLDQLDADQRPAVTSNRAVIAGGLTNYRARLPQPDRLLDCLAANFTATLPDGSIVSVDDIRSGRIAPTAIGLGLTDREVVAVRGERLSLLRTEDHWSVEEIDPDGHLLAVARFAYLDLQDAVRHLEDRALTHADAPPQADGLIAMRRAIRERDIDALDVALHPEFAVIDRRPLGFERMDRHGFLSFMRDDVADAALASVPVISEIIASSEHGSVARNAMWSGGSAGEFWQTSPAINVIMVLDGQVVVMEMFADDERDAAVARFHELDAEASADTIWNRADRAARELSRLISTGRIGEAILAEDIVMDDRRPLVRNSYVGRDALVEGFSTTGTTRPWQADFCDTLAARSDTLVLWTQRWSKIDDPGTVMESLVIHRINTEGLIDRMVLFDPDDLSAAIEELDRLHVESLDTTDLLELRYHALLDLHYGGLNAGDLELGMAMYHPSSVFVDHRPLAWGTLDSDGIRTRMQTIAESPDQYFHYLRRILRSTPTSGCLIGRNHAITAEGFVNDSDILSVFTIDPTTGGPLRSEQFDSAHLDAALARHDEFVAAAATTQIPPNRSVLAGGLANLRARHREPDRFVDGLADGFTATLPDGSAVTVDHLRAGTFTPSDVGFGITERELIAVRGERLALLRIEGTRWSIEETDEHDRLVRITLFEADDLFDAVDNLEVRSRLMPDHAAVPDSIWQWMRAHQNFDVDGHTGLIDEAFRMVDHRPLGYAPMDRSDGLRLFRAGIDDETLRGVPVYSAIHAVNAHSCVMRGAMWTQGGSSEYWIGLPFVGVYCSADGKLTSIDMFPADDLAAAMTRFEELSRERPRTSAERWLSEGTELINEGRVDDFAERLAEGFTEDSRRSMFSFVLDRDQFVDGLRIFVEQGLTMKCLGVVATAGDLGGLQRGEVAGDGTASTFLQVGLYDSDGNLVRMIDFDEDRLDDALAELAEITGEPVIVLDPPLN